MPPEGFRSVFAKHLIVSLDVEVLFAYSNLFFNKSYCIESILSLLSSSTLVSSHILIINYLCYFALAVLQKF